MASTPVIFISETSPAPLHSTNTIGGEHLSTNLLFLQGPDNYWRLCSSLKRYDPLYTLTIVYKDGVTTKEREQTLKK